MGTHTWLPRELAQQILHRCFSYRPGGGGGGSGASPLWPLAFPGAEEEEAPAPAAPPLPGLPGARAGFPGCFRAGFLGALALPRGFFGGRLPKAAAALAGVHDPRSS